MAEDKMMRLSQVAKLLNVGISTVVSNLSANGHKVENNPNAKINSEQLGILSKEYKVDYLLSGASPKREDTTDTSNKQTGDSPILYFRDTPATPPPAAAPVPEPPKPVIVKEPEVVVVPEPVVIVPEIKIEEPKEIIAPKVEPIAVVPEKIEPIVVEVIEPKTEAPQTVGLRILGKIDLSATQKPTEKHKKGADKSKKGAFQEKPKTEAPKQTETKVEKTNENIAPRIENKPKEQPNVEEKSKVEASTPAIVVEKPKKIIEPVVEPELIKAKGDTLKGFTVIGKIELPVEAKKGSSEGDRRRKRKRMKKGEKVVDTTQQAGKKDTPTQTDASKKPAGATGTSSGTNANRPANANANTNRPANAANSNNNNNKGKKDNKGRGGKREEISKQDVTDSIKSTFARMAGNAAGKNFGADKRRERRRARAEAAEEQAMLDNEDAKTLKVTEFISANDLASLMDASVQEVISVCMSMGMFVSINQRLDAEAITLITDEFGFDVQFISAEEEIKGDIIEIVDAPEDLLDRAPVVTIMGHVDHGKTSLLDYIRKTRVTAGEAGGITQHIGAYSVKTEAGRQVTFLDTPGHEAFTAMRARGAKVTDVVIIVIAADDSIMPQTREAINHAQNAGVPIVFAFSKIDKPGANTEKIREALAGMNILVEDWGGKYQSQEISSKSGAGISDLLEKVCLEADILELKANPNRNALGTVIEASLDKGRGYLSTVLIQTGTLKIGDPILAGPHHGRVKAMFDSRGEKLKEAGPSTPVQLLGLNGAPQAGDNLNAMSSEREAREIANKREQIIREQSIRTRKHITLDEIGRRKAIGNFKELNVIVKGDVDGSVEALSDSLLKLSTDEVQVNIIHKGVGQISESDINLAIASDAIVIGFQVRPSSNAKKLAEQEQIEIRLYSIIYNAINEIKDAMVGLLEPKVEEVIVGNAEIREVFKISKIGTVAGCYVTDGNIKRNNKVRVLRDFIVIYEGEIMALKRYKDDVNEVKNGFEFGMSIKGFNDLIVGDVIESFELKEVKRTL